MDTSCLGTCHPCSVKCVTNLQFAVVLGATIIHQLHDDDETTLQSSTITAFAVDNNKVGKSTDLFLVDSHTTMFLSVHSLTGVLQHPQPKTIAKNGGEKESVSKQQQLKVSFVTGNLMKAGLCISKQTKPFIQSKIHIKWSSLTQQKNNESCPTSLVC